MYLDRQIPLAAAGPSRAPLIAATAGCARCPIHRLCLPAGLDSVSELDQIAGRRRQVGRGDILYRSGERFASLYAVRFGLFKTARPHPGMARDHQITGFRMAGELLGMDGIGAGEHQSDAVALEDSEVCEIPFSQLAALFATMPALLRQFNRSMSAEIMREQELLLLLGSMRAEQRVAVFLVNLAGRYAARGFPATMLQLRMSREDIGNFLGLTVESVSRLLSRFRKEGWIAIERRKVTLLAPAMLAALASGATAPRPV
jgi:CRP/FNR family transcriptional regulator